MIVLTTSSSSQSFKFIPRIFDTSVTFDLTDDITFDALTPSASTVTQVGDFINYVFEVSNLKEARFYTLRVKRTSDDAVVYKDKVFVTDQGIDQSAKEKYTINKDEYVEKSTSDNDYIVI